MFLHKNYQKKIYQAIKESKLLENKEYVYSDLSFYLYPKIIENIEGVDFETYLKQNFYNQIGAYTLGFNPLNKFKKEQIIPTENDTFFRMKQIHGTVHDEGAALLGGISGHAGLFGTALDLAKMTQMYLNMGEYGGHRFISDTTMKQFTKCQFPENNNRRGIGFDKPLLKNKQEGMSAIDASDESFGHSGFTGTFCWADPKNGLLYILMTNRVYPTRNNSKISQLNIRPSIHQVFYDAIKNSGKN
jgi:CubicO group peptidase (beta-lactamase class C family)